MSTLTPDRARQGWIRIRTATTSKEKNVDDNNLAPHGELYLQLKKMIDHLPDSAEGKARWSLHRWFGIDTQKDVMYCPTYNVNLCVLVYHLFHYDVDTVKMEDYISTIFKRLKSQKITKFCTFVWYKFPRNTYTTILVTMGSILP